jgi:L,D-transpeptidase ErfK/SrfK
MMKKIYFVFSVVLSFLFLNITYLTAYANEFNLHGNPEVVGHNYDYTVNVGDSLVDISRQFNVGYFEIKEMNPDQDIVRLQEGQQLVIPSQFVLPNTPHEGIIINLPELRLYYYQNNGKKLFTCPVGIGRKNSETPLVTTKVIKKEANPKWRPTDNTRREALEKGVVLPAHYTTGPDNPLGEYALYLAVPFYLIHGTNDPSGVGIRSSGGCIRLYPEDIKMLYEQVAIGTPVTIVNQPFKLGWNGDELELEAHVSLGHKQGESLSAADMGRLKVLLNPYITNQKAVIDWDQVSIVAEERAGIPKVIGHRAGSSSVE